VHRFDVILQTAHEVEYVPDKIAFLNPFMGRQVFTTSLGGTPPSHGSRPDGTPTP
jgi:hypothetical protein